MKQRFAVFATVALAVGLMLAPTPSLADPLVLTEGSPIIAIDGDADSNVTVNILSVGGALILDYGYFLNGSPIFTSLPGFVSLTTFQGGDVIDFALHNLFTDTYYTLSGDAADPSYSVLMTFANQVTVGSPQQPASWTAPYYYNANISWSLPAVVNTNEFAINLGGNLNDGIAPVAEPASLLLLGSGLLGLGLAELPAPPDEEGFPGLPPGDPEQGGVLGLRDGLEALVEVVVVAAAEVADVVPGEGQHEVHPRLLHQAVQLGAVIRKVHGPLSEKG